METNKNDTSSTKSGLDSLSKDELITKYKGLLNIAKKAKQAKDELAEENRLLKETLQRNETQKDADKKALLTMKETLEQFTEQKLQLSTQIDKLRQQNRQSQEEKEIITQLRIENESLRRQLHSLTNENETLLNDIDAMENQLKQVNIIGIEQKKHLELLEHEVNQLKERESHAASLEQRLNVSLAENKCLKEQENSAKKSLSELIEKYKLIKEINSQQRNKFNALKERFVEVLGKLKKLKECKRILLETQQEYAEAVSKWQSEIIHAARQLCKQLHTLKAENEVLTKKLDESQQDVDNKSSVHINIDTIATNLQELNNLANIALEERRDLLTHLNVKNDNPIREDHLTDLEVLNLEYKRLTQELQDLSIKISSYEELLTKLKQSINFKFDDSEQENLETLINALEEQARKKIEIETELESCKLTKIELDKELRNVRAELDNITQHYDELTKQKTNLEGIVHNLKQTVETQKQNYIKMEAEYDAFKSNTLKSIEILKLDLNNKHKIYDELFEEHQHKLQENNEFLTQRTTLETQLNECKLELDNQTKQHSQLKLEIAALKNAKLKEKDSEYDLNSTLQIYEQNMLKLQEKYADKEQEFAELLMEKSEIQSKNQYLTEKLEIHLEKCKELELAQQALEKNTQENEQLTRNKKLEKYRQIYDELQAKHELKEREHADLLDEMRELNEALKKRGDLISRQEARQNELNAELKRLQQIENSLKEKEQLIEQKDNELKQINEEVKTSQIKVQELEVACTRSEEHINAITEELQNLKQNLNNCDTQSDVMSIASTMSRAEELNLLREVDESLEERYTKLKALAVKLKKKLQEQTTLNNEMEQKLKESKNNNKDAELKEQQQLIEALMAENKKLKASRKQTNVLNLEIEAAEKSLSEVSAKLTAKTNELSELNAVLQTKESTIVQLRKEIAILEGAKLAECEHSKELKTQIDLLQTQIKDAVHSKQTTLDAYKNLEQTQEQLKHEIENLRLQLTQNESNQITKQAALNTENAQLNAKIAELETTLQTTKTMLKTTERALENLRCEHTEYKLKAQAVLRKNQTKDTTRERELEEELTTMRQKTQQLEALTNDLKQKIEENDIIIENLREHNKQQLQRNQELNKCLEDLKKQNEALNKEQRSLLQQQQDALNQQRQQIENLDACHKEQIENMELNYQREIEHLKTELNKAMRPSPIIGAVARQYPDQMNRSNDLAHLMEREDAEGSESVNVVTLSSLASKRKISNASSTRRSQHDFMPLDELLNAPMYALNCETLLNTTNNNDLLENSKIENISTDFVEQLELQAAKERLQIQESRVRHLTALLAENEQDLAKLTQMNDMLKEELRRQERSEEREQHMQNSEYLKNVIIKFLTLNNADEKARLVPVLNTILKLTRTEVDMLNCVAKGQKIAEPNSRSWSNFLPSWGGGGGN